MSQLTITVARFGLLAALWVFVLCVVAVIRTDIYGTQVKARTARRTRTAAAATPAAAPTASAPGRGGPRSIVVTDGALVGTAINLTGAPILIGRNPEATLVLDDDYASGRHARIYEQDGRWFVEDLGSTNGTFVGRQRTSGPTVLSTGSSIRIGQTVLELRK
jgi:hypothetical protein